MKFNSILATCFLATFTLLANSGVSQQSSQPDNAGPIKFSRQKLIPGKVIAIELSNDGSTLAVGGLDKTVTLLSTEDFSVLAKTQAPVGMILDLIYSSDGKYLVSCGDRKQVLVMDAKDLSVKLDYELRFRAERAAESTGGEFIVAGRSGQLATLSFSEMSSKYLSTHKSFVGGLCSSSHFETTYSAGDQADGPYFLSRKTKTLQKIASLPGRPSRVTAGPTDAEVLVATENHALRIDVAQNQIVDLWHLPKAQKVEDIIYWEQRNLYVTSDKAGFVKLWQPGKLKPVASHQVSKFDVYQVIALDGDRLIVCGRQAPPGSMSIWKLDFDESKFPKYELVSQETASPTQESEATAEPKEHQQAGGVAASATQAAGEPSPQPANESAGLASQTTTETDNTPVVVEPSPWLPLNADFEVKRINPAELNLRSDRPSTKLQHQRKIKKLKDAKQPVPDSLKNFEPVQIHSAIVSTGGKLFLATSDGLVQYDFENGASLVKDNSSNPIHAASLARDPVDGILIGLKDRNEVLELRESGKLVSRGLLEADLEVEDKSKLSVSQVVSSGSDYLALSNDAIYRRFPEGHWEQLPLYSENKPIARFSLLDSREIITADAETIDIRNHPRGGISRKIQASRKDGHTGNSENILVNSASNMKVKKLVAMEDGICFCVFVRPRTPTGKPLTQSPFDDKVAVSAGGCTLTGSFLDNLVTSHDFDWGVDGLPEKDRTVVDLHPGPSGAEKDVWFLTPKGLGLFTGDKTEFWRSQFKLERKKAEPSRIQSLGDGSLAVFTTDGVHSEDMFLIRPSQSPTESVSK